jgi:uncharacterized protein YeaO (DUF488 family)
LCWAHTANSLKLPSRIWYYNTLEVYLIVKTKHIYDQVEESDGERLLVSRSWARPYSKKKLAVTDWLKTLAPSEELHDDWQERKNSWEEYTVRYHEEMRGQLEAIRDLAKRANRDTITLLCCEYEDNPCCHRHLLKRLIEDEERNVE